MITTMLGGIIKRKEYVIPPECYRSPEEHLILMIILYGVYDKDIYYFKGEAFTFHCGLLGVDAEIVKPYFLRMIKNIR